MQLIALDEDGEVAEASMFVNISLSDAQLGAEIRRLLREYPEGSVEVKE
jgi:hypothetical protein